MKIAVTGSSGFMASRVLEYYQKIYEVCGLNHTQLDITDKEQVQHRLGEIRPDVVVHCAAVSDIPTCDENPELSWKINANGTSHIAAACCGLGAKLIFCSSDQVYLKNGVTTPHLESEPLNPPHLYGKQKVRAEELALEQCPDAVGLRLSMMYAADYEGKSEHSNFLKNLADSVRDKKELRFLVHDRRSITDVWDVVRNLEKLFTAPGGIYNFGSENELSPYAVAERLLEGTEAAGLLKKNEEAFADESRNLSMDIGKIKALGIIFPTTLDGLLANWKKG